MVRGRGKRSVSDKSSGCGSDPLAGQVVAMAVGEERLGSSGFSRVPLFFLEAISMRRQKAVMMSC